MNVLVFSTVFPSPQRPLLGLFVRERVLSTRPYADVRVVAPVSCWSRTVAGGPHTSANLHVQHPRFWYVPGLSKGVEPFCLACSALPAIRAMSAQAPFDLIDSHFGYPDGVAAALLAAIVGCPFTVTLRGSELIFAEFPLRRRLLGWALRRAARVIAVSAELAQLAVSLGVGADRVAVIPNGVNASFFVPADRRSAAQSLGRSPDEELIVSVGHLTPVKGFDRLIRALPGIVEHRPKAHLVIVGGASSGSGHYPDQLRRLASSLRLSDRVSLTGALHRQGVRDWLQAASVFALASWREGSPNVILEAMACGAPVAASAVGEVPLMVPPDAGIVIRTPASDNELGTALERALERDWDRPAIRRLAEGRSWDRVATAVVEQWEFALERGAVLPPCRAESRRLTKP